MLEEMECNKFALLLAAMPPTVTAACNEVMPFPILTNTNIRNPLTNLFLIDKPAHKCDPSGALCYFNMDCCSGTCSLFSDAPFLAYCA
ncbi:hypothetical protein V6N13_062666 [Hibiscus sabdariffa]